LATFCHVQLQAEAAEHQRRREEAAAVRLSALKNASLPEYLALLRQAKNGRLQEVLGQTDACLRQLAEKLGVAGGCGAVWPYGRMHAWNIWRCCGRPRMAGCRRCLDRRMHACGSWLKSWEWQVGVVLWKKVG
jgi:hypothetical protein